MNQILYVQKKLNSSKLIIGLTVLLIICIAFLSTIFSILNMGNENIVSGVRVCGIDVSNMSVEKAKARIEREISRPDDTATVDIIVNNLKYTTPIANIGISPDYDAMIESAYNVGRSGNFIENNFAIQQAYMFGKDITYVGTINDDIFNELLITLKQNISETKVDDTYVIDKEFITITKGTDGVALDSDSLKEDILVAYAKDDLKTVTAKIENIKAKKVDLDALFTEVTKAPENASTTVENNTIIFKESVDGISFALTDAKFLYNNSADSTVKIPLVVTKATITSDSLMADMFKDTLSTYTTEYRESEKNRTTNVKLAASKINGVILMPGQEFSYNKVVGERTVANGFKTATIYSGGKLEQGLGGGICQVSSTLYNVALLANMNVTERKNHMFAVSYVPLGRDATVVYGNIDFKFINNRKTPVKIYAETGNGKLTMTMYGTKSPDDVEVTLKTVTNSSQKYSTQTIEDNTMDAGKQVTVQSGHYGYTVSAYKITSRNGKELSNDLLYKDTYSPLQAIVRVGTKSTAPVVDTPVVDPVIEQPTNPTEPEPDSDPVPTVPPGWDVPENPYN